MEEVYRMEDEEEEDVMALLFAANGSDGNFMSPLVTGKGKGKSRAAAMDDVIDSPGVYRGFFKYEGSTEEALQAVSGEAETQGPLQVLNSVLTVLLTVLTGYT